MYDLDGSCQVTPPDRRRMWRNLALTMSQASALTGVSERQIQHWMDRGYISPATAGTRKLSGESVDTIVLILQARAAGIPLRRAVPMAREYVRREAAGALDTGIAPAVMQEIHEQLDAVRAGIDAVQQKIYDMEVDPLHLSVRKSL